MSSRFVWESGQSGIRRRVIPHLSPLVRKTFAYFLTFAWKAFNPCWRRVKRSHRHCGASLFIDFIIVLDSLAMGFSMVLQPSLYKSGLLQVSKLPLFIMLVALFCNLAHPHFHTRYPFIAEWTSTKHAEGVRT